MLFLKKNLGIIIFARASSKRLPKKVFSKINKTPLIKIIIKRVKSSKFKFPIVIATSKNKSDDAIEEFCIKNNVKCFRGNLLNVFERTIKCCEKYNFDYFVRVCADRPFFDYDLMDRMIIKFFNKNYDIVTNQLKKTYPKGLACEIGKIDLFKKTKISNLSKSDREHIFNYFYKKKKNYKIFNFVLNKEYKKKKLSLDTKSDLKKIIEIYKKNKFNFKIKNKNLLI